MRFFGMTVVVALVFTALVAVGTLLFGKFGETTARILGTSAAVAGYMLLVMGAAASSRPGSSRLARATGPIAMGLSVLAFAMLVLLIWVESV